MTKDRAIREINKRFATEKFHKEWGGEEDKDGNFQEGWIDLGYIQSQIIAIVKAID
jgi:hypothetical protein